MSSYVNIRTEWLAVMTVTEAVVYGYLHGWLVDRGDKAVPFRQTQAAMAAALHMPSRTFKRTLTRLESKGFVAVRTEGSALAYACMINNVESAILAQRDESAKMAQPKCQSGTTESAKMAQPTLLNKYNNHDINTSENAHAYARDEAKKKEEIERQRQEEAKHLAEVMKVDALADELRKEFANGSSVAEGFAYNYGLTVRQMDEWLGYFVNTLRIAGVTLKTRSDFRRHFISWLTNQLQKK